MENLRGSISSSPVRCFVLKGDNLVSHKIVGIRLFRVCLFEVSNELEKNILRISGKKAIWMRQWKEKSSPESGGLVA